MPSKFLIIQTAFTGDVVLATSLIENLHAAFPAAQIDFLVRKGNETLLQGHPHLSHLYVWNKKEKKIGNLLKLLFSIRKEKYDKVINLQRYAATGVLTAFSGAREKSGFDKNPLSFLFTRKIRHEFGRQGSFLHEIERNHQLISNFVNEKPMRPKLYPSAEDEQIVSTYTGKPFITISPASVWFTKQYPSPKWAAFIDKIPKNTVVYLLGGIGDRSLCEAVIQMTKLGSTFNLAGELSFLQSAALMKHARMNYVNDSAPMHFASAMNAPVTVVYCSTIPAFGYGPLSDQRNIVERQGPLYCRPCGLHGYDACPQEHFKCALEIDEDQLLNCLPDEIKS